jgi:cysteine desulfurase / selenocysteine lyase
VSNALGTVPSPARNDRLAHRGGVPVLVDGAQAVPHFAVDVQALDCDFYAFSGHKVYGPTGIGVLYGKRALLNAMPPYQGGGDMISSVTFEKTTYNDLPSSSKRARPTSPAPSRSARRSNTSLTWAWKIAAHEHELLAYATEAVGAIPGVRSSEPPSNAPECSRLCSMACIRTIWERFSTAKALPSAPATTARSR